MIVFITYEYEMRSVMIQHIYNIKPMESKQLL